MKQQKKEAPGGACTVAATRRSAFLIRQKEGKNCEKKVCFTKSIDLCVTPNFIMNLFRIFIPASAGRHL
ncbi:MAG: hypothetical protein LUG47_00670 [Clostridiales bacterium]|nr:hypothetical protein [Clostridiales bacterium]